MLLSGLSWAADAGETMVLSFLGPAALCEWPGTGVGIEASLTTVVFVGMGLGTLFWGRYADQRGRKPAFVISGLLTAVAGLASAFSWSVDWLLFFRMTTGFGIGGIAMAYAMFVEMVPTQSRGFWSALIQSFWSVGTVSLAGLAWWLLREPGWRVVLALAGIPLLIVVLCYAYFIKESPRHLVHLGRVREAEEVLQYIARLNGKPELCDQLTLDPALTAPSTERYGTVDRTATAPPSSCLSRTRSALVQAVGAFGRLLAPNVRTTTLLIWVLWVANAMVYYGIVLLSTEIRLSPSSGEKAPCVGGHVNLNDADFASISIDAVAELPGTILAALIVDRVGRRFVMLRGEGRPLAVMALLARRNGQVIGFGVASGACAILLFLGVSVGPIVVDAPTDGGRSLMSRAGRRFCSSSLAPSVSWLSL
jgi:MFS family permease